MRRRWGVLWHENAAGDQAVVWRMSGPLKSNERRERRLGAEDEIGADGKAEESREGLGYKE